MKQARAKIWFDGACHNIKNRFTPMGIGLIIEFPDKHQIHISYTPPFLGTSNVAEWIGCYIALCKADELLCTKQVDFVEIFSDSQLIVRQINEIYEVSSEQLRPYFEKCNLIFNRNKHLILIQHIRRENNRLADKHSKIALKRSFV